MTRDRFALHRSPWRAWATTLVVAVIVLVAGCGGGGGGSGGVDTGGTGAPATSFSAGRIAGFGSIVVNDVHYDETTAAIVGDDGRSRRPSDLQLGMTVEVDAGPILRDPGLETASSSASRITIASAIEGPVEGVDAAGATLRVLGQAVKVDVNTVIAGVPALGALRAGDPVEVHAFFDPTTASYTATRLERRARLDAYKLRGPIADLDTAARTFRIGAATVDYGDVRESDLPGLANGVVARVELRAAPRGGRWSATRLQTPLPGIPESTVTDIEGYVTGFQSAARFTVDGVTVDASGPGVVFDRGNPGQLADGARIEVEGRMQGGVLAAERVEVRRARGDAPEEREEFKLRGRIESADVAARAFVVRGIVVTFDDATRFDDGDAADLRAGATVRVEGTLVDGMRLRAERIRLRDR